MSDTIWRDDPPTEPGLYWVRSRSDPRQQFTWDVDSGSLGSLWDVSEVQFGPRVPDPETCARIERGE